MKTKALLIHSCDDPSKWYYLKQRAVVPLLAIEETEYKTLQDNGIAPGHRFINFVSKKDATIVEIDNEKS